MARWEREAPTLSRLLITDWWVYRMNTGGALPPVELFPGAGVAAWESAGGPAVWNVPTTEGTQRIFYEDTINPTQTGVYDYKPGVSFTRAQDVSYTPQLHEALVATRRYRSATDLNVTALSGEFFFALAYVQAVDPDDPMGTATWYARTIHDFHVAVAYNEFILGMTGIGWSPVTANWNGTAPANFGDALNRLAAHLGPIP